MSQGKKGPAARPGWPPDWPGSEIGDQDARDGARNLVANEGWGYSSNTKTGGYPMLYPPDPQHKPIRVPKTGHTKGRGPQNLAAAVLRSGGSWKGKVRKQKKEGENSE
jgi:hypothetical protein